MENAIVIRQANAEDANALLEIYAPYVKQTAISFEYTVPDVEEFQNRIRNIKKRYPYFVAEEGRRIVGYAYAGAFHSREAYNWAAETTVYIRQGEKRKGIGRKLYDALESALKVQGVLNMYACIAYPQGEDPYLTIDSPAFHQRMGFLQVGQFHHCGYKFNRWYDMIWMEKIIGEHLDRQPSVVPFGELK
jgi:phosphinothricin acetyltransferase